MKKALSSILGILAVMAMEFLLLIMLVDPDWFRNVMVIIGVILLGLLFATILLCTGYAFGRDIERTNADSYIESLREKHTKEINQLNANWNTDIRAETSRLDKEHSAEITRLKEKHSEETSQLTDLIAQLSTQMSQLGLQLPHNQQLISELNAETTD